MLLFLIVPSVLLVLLVCMEQDQDYLPAVLGMATGFMVEKNQHKARNLLKRVAKMELNQVRMHRRRFHTRTHARTHKDTETPTPCQSTVFTALRKHAL